MMENELKPKMLERQKLDKILTRSCRKTLVYLYGFMGSGKTTAVEMHLKRAKKRKTAWFTCPDETLDEQWSWRRFVETLEAKIPEVAAELKTVGYPDSAHDITRIMDVFTQKLAEETTIVIDDYQFLRNTQIRQLIVVLTKQQVPHLHLILISRNPPEPIYEEFALKGFCAIIGQEYLNFSPSEAEAFFKKNGFKLNPKEKEGLEAYCGGWTAAVYLGLLNYARDGEIAAIEQAETFVWSAVCEKLDPEEKKILVILSNLDRFTLDQADFVTETTQASHFIKQLYKKNCFVHYHAETKTYQLHTILKNAVVSQCYNSKMDEKAINHRSGVWYQRQNMPLSALSCFYKAGSDEAILGLMEQRGATELFDQAPALLTACFKAIPVEKRLDHPWAYLSFLCSYMVVSEPARAWELLTQAKAFYENQTTLPDKKRILGEIALIESYACFNDLDAMVDRHQQAYEAFEGGTSRIQFSNMDFAFGSPSILYLYYSQFGRLEETLERFKKDGWYYTHVSSGCGAGHEYVLQAEYNLGTGNYEAAGENLEKAKVMAEEKKQKSITIAALFQQMRLALHLGDEKKMRECRKKMDAAAQTSDVPSQRHSAEIAKGYISAVMGQWDEIPSWLRQGMLDYYTAPPQSRGMAAIVWGMSAIRENNPLSLEVHADLLLEQSRKDHFVIGEIYARILKAIALEQQKRDGSPILEKLLGDLEKDGYYSPVVELSPHLMPLLNRLPAESTRGCMKACQHFNGLYANYHGVQDAGLTQREREVLFLLCHGYARQEIGNELKIGLPTVKTHIRNIYNKLQVSKKADAIKKADKLSLS